MELAKIEALLERYFEGKTSLQQEQELQAYFTTAEVPAHLELYKPLFLGFELAREETSERNLELPKETTRRPFWKMGVAASFLVAMAAAWFIWKEPGMTQEQQEALAAFEETKEAMYLLSESLNKGTSSMVHLNEFEKGSSRLSFINQFSESKNLILK